MSTLKTSLHFGTADDQELLEQARTGEITAPKPRTADKMPGDTPEERQRMADFSNDRLTELINAPEQKDDLAGIEATTSVEG